MIFYTEALLSKWGFDDGDLLGEMLLEKLGEDYFKLDQKEILFEVVRDHIVPKISNNIEIYYINTCHNPVRADKVDGIRVNDTGDNDISIVPEKIEVEDNIILEIANTHLAKKN